jgi:uncharacterized protein (DUF1800 family)
MLHESEFVALNRFGLGARPGEPDAIAGRAHAWVTDQIRQAKADPVPGVADTQARLHQLDAYRRAKAAADKAEAAAVAAGKPPPKLPAGTKPPPSPLDEPPNKIFDNDLSRRAEQMIASDAPVVERLAAFWSNHFAISATRDELSVLAVPYENEAVRPFLFGTFRDMLAATAMHPAMTVYLDAASSVGPASAYGMHRHKSINENYAREVMELHTLGVNGGYTQKDVDELALALTGLGVDAADGESAWFFDRHEPGPRMLLGRMLPEGANQPQAAFDILANHPATIRHVSTKLAAHICGDTPPRAVVQRLVHAWRASGGNLPAVYLALAASPEAWVTHPVKYRTPQDFVLAAARALDLRGHGRALLSEIRFLGQSPFRAPAPTGWSDADGDWLNPAGTVARVESALRLAALAHAQTDATDTLAQAAYVTGNANVLDIISEEPDQHRAIALVLASPEFQRR